MSGVASAIGDVNGKRVGGRTDTSQDLVVQALQGGNSSNMNGKQEKKKINICIKKKFTSSSSAKKKKHHIDNQTANADNSAIEEKQTRAQKANNVNMAKWAAQRVDETKADENTSTSDYNIDITQSTRKIKLTKAGKPICCICKRKFADVDKLKQHEKLSALHKQNLAKKRKDDIKAASEYRDRASERRTMYEVDSNITTAAIDPSIVNMGPSLEKARVVTTTEIVTPVSNLGDTNVGNKLLQKLGWKNGESLGRKPDENAGPAPSSVGMEDTLIKLKQDWERIEHLSGKKH